MKIKNLFKILVPSFLKEMKKGYSQVARQNPSMSIIDVFLQGKLLYTNPKLDYRDDYVRQLAGIFKKIDIATNVNYVYPYDPKVVRIYHRHYICSVTVDYGKVLKSNLNELRNYIIRTKDMAFRERQLRTINEIENLGKRILEKLLEDNGERQKLIARYFAHMLYGTPKCLDEALQKILFYNALFWQMGHSHIGLGRLDLILYSYYEKDISERVISEVEARNMLRNFILTLGKDTQAKSMSITGDTGQYIMLGGIDCCRNNVDNKLTEFFLELMTELNIPDPKLILRANEHTPDSVWHKSIQCVMTGIGSPLIMDEKPVMENMERFGYDASDVWNVGTSACWEPLIIGKSFDQNNPFRSAIAIKPLNEVILQVKNYRTFDELYLAYKREFKKEIESVVKDIDFDCSPLFTLFFDDCISREKDFTAGGAIYANHGVQVVSLPNTVNALLNIKRLVFEEHLFTITDCRKAIANNFEDMDDFRTILQTTGDKFGSTNEEVVSLTNDLIRFTGNVVKPLTSNGEPVKVGFSSPAYIYMSRNIQASLDGRKFGDPFAVHISPISSKIDFSEILDFSSMLVYNDNCINGNVVDFILPSSYIKHPDKLVSILKNACANGIFELQLNVMDKATLIDAKAHPDKYPNLIVRVWGFSAYFNDLPEEFKDNLIRRAEIYEAA